MGRTCRGQLTIEQKDKCLASKGWDCPYCGSQDLTWFGWDIINGCQTRPIQCEDCKMHWRITYAPVKVTSLPGLNKIEFEKQAARAERQRQFLAQG
jgi:hypothetical protein